MVGARGTEIQWGGVYYVCGGVFYPCRTLFFDFLYKDLRTTCNTLALGRGHEN